MYARITTFQIDPARLDAMIEVSRSSILPTMKQQRGFQGILTLLDRPAGKATSITLWETEADLHAGENSGYYQQQASKLASFLTASPVRETYEATLDL